MTNSQIAQIAEFLKTQAPTPCPVDIAAGANVNWKTRQEVREARRELESTQS